ncbi:MAG TPA: hypothetical protein VII93_10725, partial [Anaerolineales bacterium]
MKAALMRRFQLNFPSPHPHVHPAIDQPEAHVQFHLHMPKQGRVTAQHRHVPPGTFFVKRVSE